MNISTVHASSKMNLFSFADHFTKENNVVAINFSIDHFEIANNELNLLNPNP